jgi:predicted metal-dependent enzyme (double-stranded beta helix superfamily)
MFDCDQFVADCRTALADSTPEKAAREVVARAVSDPAGVLAGLGEPTEAGVFPIVRAPDLTVINVVWNKFMTILPHNHEMWAVIGIYTGREDNIFWRRIEDEAGHQIEAAGAKSLCEKDAVPLGRDIIHSVTNPINRLSGAIHVYGGDFFRDDRRAWHDDGSGVRPFDAEEGRELLCAAASAARPAVGDG